MDISKIGKEGEQIAREIFFKVLNIESLFQADWIMCKNGKWYLAEIKHQERFEKWKDDDVEGHGLPIRQVQARLSFQKDTGVRCLFFVIEKPNKNVFWQWLDVLENGIYQDTPKKNRRVYDIKSFKMMNIKLKEDKQCLNY